MRRAAALLLALGCAAHPAPGSVAASRSRDLDGARIVEEIAAVPTRAGVTQPFLLVTRAADGGAPPRAVALMLPGGDGAVGLPADVAQLGPGRNFLVRARDLFCDAELAVAILDAPSDHRSGMDDRFRASSEHARDIGAVVGWLRGRFPGAKVFLVGTSRGTLSAAHAGRALGDAVDGVVLTSTVFLGSAHADGLERFDFAAIKAPLLLVHHEDDGCRSCPYDAARQLGRRFPLVSVSGGRLAESGPCEPFSPHGYFGREREAASAIRSWMLGRPYPARVGG